MRKGETFPPITASPSPDPVHHRCARDYRGGDCGGEFRFFRQHGAGKRQDHGLDRPVANEQPRQLRRCRAQQRLRRYAVGFHSSCKHVLGRCGKRLDGAVDLRNWLHQRCVPHFQDCWRRLYSVTGCHNARRSLRSKGISIVWGGAAVLLATMPDVERTIPL